MRTELTFGPLRSTRRKLWLKRSDRITRGVYRETFIILLFIRRALTSFTGEQFCPLLGDDVSFFPGQSVYYPFDIVS